MVGDTTVGQFCPFSYGKGLPERLRNSSGRIPVYGSNGIVGWHDIPLTQGPTVIIGRKGTVGAVHLSLTTCWPIDTTFFVEFADVREARFAYYLLKTLGLEHMNSDSAVPGLNRDAAHARSVRIPDAAHRAAIACILGALDDKMELNRRMNQTLEEMARAIFKSWFVDFDPVRAKTAGHQPPGLAPHIADLFPDAFEQSELGEIPKGWRLGCFGDVAANHRRGVSPNEIDPTTPYIGLEHMPRRCVALDQWQTAESLGSGKFRFSKGEILFGKLRPYFHKVGVAPVSGICSTDILVITPKSCEWFGFVLGHVSSAEFVAYTSAVSTGTKMPRVNWGDMARYEIVLPPLALAAMYDARVEALIARMQANISESRTLAALRDTLLPKLISGELRVPDAERIVERYV